MKRLARPLVVILAAGALAASAASLYVHYRLLADPSYSSFCDISETVSCEAVYQSEYGTVSGVPVAAGGAIWSALVLLLGAAGLGGSKEEERRAVAGYIFLLSVVGLAAVFYFAYASFVILGKTCLLCVAVYVAVIGTFVVSAGAAGPLGALPGRLGRDLASVLRSPRTAALAVIWLAASIGLVAWFPRGESGGGGAVAQEPSVVLETLTPEQVAEWERWIDAQPIVEGVAPPAGVKVLVLKFNDYQCPACRQTWSLYRDIIAKYEAAHPDAFRFETRDFPLEAECGSGGVHGAACEMAVAVRLAREKNLHREVEAALFGRQSPAMTREDVKATLAEVAQVTDFDARYASVLEAVRSDVQLGMKLGVTGTPTFFINGVKLPSVRPAYFDAAIAHMLRKAGVQVITAG